MNLILTSALAILLLLLMLLDLFQTQAIFASPARWTELNPVIRALVRHAASGDEPAGPVLRWYFLAAYVAAIVIARVLWTELAPAASLGWLTIVALAEGWCVVNNHRIGIRITSSF